jgi:hypothetical protein
MKRFIPILILLSSNCFGFTVNSTNKNFQGWLNPEVKFAFNLTNCPSSVDVKGIVQEALDIWNNVPTSKVNISIEADTSSTTYGDPITIICDTNYGSGSAGAADSSPGMASIRTSGNFIIGGIMYLNASSGAANIGNLSRALVAVTLAHEIGHLLGIGHSQDVNALLYYDASLKNNLALAQDDVDAVTYLYPRDEISGDKMYGGCGSIKNTSTPSSAGMHLTLLFMPLILALYLRLREFKTNIARNNQAESIL